MRRRFPSSSRVLPRAGEAAESSIVWRQRAPGWWRGPRSTRWESGRAGRDRGRRLDEIQCGIDAAAGKRCPEGVGSVAAQARPARISSADLLIAVTAFAQAASSHCRSDRWGTVAYRTGGFGWDGEAGRHDHVGSTPRPALRVSTLSGQVCRPVVREPAPALEQVRALISRLDLISDLVFQRRLYDLETLREERRLREEGEAQVKAPKAEIGERGRFPGVPSSRGCRRVGGR